MHWVMMAWVSNPVWKLLVTWRVRAREGDWALQSLLTAATASLNDTRSKLIALQEAAAVRHMRTVLADWCGSPVWRLLLTWRLRTQGGESALARELEETRASLNETRGKMIVLSEASGTQRMRLVFSQWSKTPLWRVVLTWKLRAHEGDTATKRQLDEARGQMLKMTEASATQRMRLVFSQWAKAPLWKIVLTWKLRAHEGDTATMQQLTQATQQLNDARGQMLKMTEASATERMRLVFSQWSRTPMWRIVLTWKLRTQEGDTALRRELERAQLQMLGAQV